MKETRLPQETCHWLKAATCIKGAQPQTHLCRTIVPRRTLAVCFKATPSMKTARQQRATKILLDTGLGEHSRGLGEYSRVRVHLDSRYTVSTLCLTPMTGRMPLMAGMSLLPKIAALGTAYLANNALEDISWLEKTRCS